PFLAEFRSNSLRATWPLLLILTAAFLFGGCRPKPPEHGTEWVIQAQGTEGQGVDEKLTGQIARNLERRLEGYGLRQFAVRPTTTNSIVIQIPALPEEKRDALRRYIQRRALLEFRLVHQWSDELLAQGETPPGYEIQTCRRKSANDTVSV